MTPTKHLLLSQLESLKLYLKTCTNPEDRTRTQQNMKAVRLKLSQEEKRLKKQRAERFIVMKAKF